MLEYVLGFYFSRRLSNVVLIKKDHPEWQVGKLNGVGGKVKEEELSLNSDLAPIGAMQREFKEEAGVVVDNWIPYARIIGPDYTLWCFAAYGDAIPTTAEREPVEFYSVEDITTSTLFRTQRVAVENVPWLIEMARMCIARGWKLRGPAEEAEPFYLEPFKIYTIHGGPLP